MRFIRIIFLSFLIFSLYKVFSVPSVLAIPDLNSGVNVYKKWDSILDYIKQNTSLDIRIMIVKSHRVIEQGFRNKTISYAFVDPLWYIRMFQGNLCKPLMKVEVGGMGFQRSLLIVHKDSIIRKISDLRGRTVALVNNMESSAGYFIPLHLFKRLFGNSNFEDGYFGRVIFSDSYMSVLKGVAFGKLDAGFVSSNLFEGSGVDALKNEIRVIFESSKIPQWIIAYRSDLSMKVSSFRKSLLRMGIDKKGKQILSELGFTGFLEVTKEDYLEMSRYIGVMR